MLTNCYVFVGENDVFITEICDELKYAYAIFGEKIDVAISQKVDMVI